MSSIKDIKQRMTNVGTTKQVLNAMDMVSSTKLQKARARLEGIVPLYHDVQDIIRDLKRLEDVREHAFAAPRKVKNTAYVVIASDKGLCGSYNTNVCALALKHMNAGKNEKILAIGAKSYQYFKRRDKEVLYRATDVSEAQIYEGASRLGEMCAAKYSAGEVDEVFIAYTQFESTLSHIPRVQRLLPLYDGADGGRQKAMGMDYSPDAISFLEHLMPFYLHMCLFTALSHSMACEHAARMVNMESAGKNADEIIDDLRRMYNRKRQAAITQELNEIVGSANIL